MLTIASGNLKKFKDRRQTTNLIGAIRQSPFVSRFNVNDIQINLKKGVLRKDDTDLTHGVIVTATPVVDLTDILYYISE